MARSGVQPLDTYSNPMDKEKLLENVFTFAVPSRSFLFLFNSIIIHPLFSFLFFLSPPFPPLPSLICFLHGTFWNPQTYCSDLSRTCIL
ncbi:hypothetical protein L2E82_31656 [Cichorium intybus]|uniref:Uncharacterized protein n=1 Tax=Cichorium intybus TaxID=13427 RepID=A0ACB9BEM6_CICIN|nr:hypothetical protein L2E82_31656 [Cichorium intybus]